jgi:hypothetical protein
MKPDETKSRGHGDKQPRLRERFIMALLSNPSVEAAAESVGISRVTAWRWMRDQTFLERLHEVRRDAWGRAMAQLQEAGPEAVEALRRTLREAENEAPRVSAAKTILDLGLRVVELGDIEQRLARLEGTARNNWRPDDHQPDREEAGSARRPNGRA